MKEMNLIYNVQLIPFSFRLAVLRVSLEKPVKWVIARPDRGEEEGGLALCFSLMLLVWREMFLSVLCCLCCLSQGGVSWFPPRLPRWLFQPLEVTNLPLVAASDLGRPCFSGGEEGVCSSRADCGGARTVAGPCTLFKSVCCMEKISCSHNITQPVASFTNPLHPARQVGKPGVLSVLRLDDVVSRTNPWQPVPPQ